VIAAAPAVPFPDLRSLVLILLASSLAALLSRFHRRVVLPTVVIEIVLGIIIGQQVLDIAKVDSYIKFLSQIGLAFLFFFAGLEVVEKHVPRRAVMRGTMGWGISIAIGLAVGAVMEHAGLDAKWWIVGIGLATTALGTLVPILADAGLLPTPFGVAVLGTGVSGEFWPIVVISVFLTGVYGAAAEVLLLLAFGALILVTVVLVLRARPPRVVRVLQETIHTTGQAAVRVSVLVLGALVLLAHDVGFDFVLGALAAGLVVGLALDSPEGAVVRMRLEGIGFGFLIPIYFVVTGMTFDLDSLLTAKGLSLAALFLALLIVVRGASSILWARDLAPRETLGLAFCGATGLPLIVAIVGIGTDRDAISSAVGASLVGAGMLSVLVFPLVATRIVGRAETPTPVEPVLASVTDEY
jgi:Kef-type K+ transport system membrane component KefB